MPSNTDKLHDLADKMEDKLKRVYTKDALDQMDCDMIRQAYEDHFGKDALTSEYDRIDSE